MKPLSVRRRLSIGSAGHVIVLSVAPGFAYVNLGAAFGATRYAEVAASLLRLEIQILPILTLGFALQLLGVPLTKTVIGRVPSRAVSLSGWLVVAFLATTAAALLVTQDENCLAYNTACFPAPWARSLYSVAHPLVGGWLMTLGIAWSLAGNKFGKPWLAAGGILLAIAAGGLLIPIPLLLTVAWGLAAVANLVLALGFACFARTTSETV